MADNTAQEVPGEDVSSGVGSPRDPSGATIATVLPTDGEIYVKTKTRCTMKGELYEVKMAAMLFLRLMNSEKILTYRLATNVEKAGALDDILLTFTTSLEPTVTRTIFIQLKHKDKAVLRLGSFQGPSGDFALKKYFNSYLDIKHCMSTPLDERPVLFDGDFEKCHFVIYTNAPAHKSLSGRSRENCTGDLEDIMKSDWENELIFRFSGESDSDVCSSVTEDEDLHLEAKEFLESLTIFSGQPNENQLNDIIKDELLLACPGKTKTEIDLIYPFYEETFKHWWRESDVVLN